MKKLSFILLTSLLASSALALSSKCDHEMFVQIFNHTDKKVELSFANVSKEYTWDRHHPANVIQPHEMEWAGGTSDGSIDPWKGDIIMMEALDGKSLNSAREHDTVSFNARSIHPIVIVDQEVSDWRLKVMQDTTQECKTVDVVIDPIK